MSIEANLGALLSILKKAKQNYVPLPVEEIDKRMKKYGATHRCGNDYYQHNPRKDKWLKNTSFNRWNPCTKPEGELINL